MNMNSSNRSVLSSTGETKYLAEISKRLSQTNVSVIKEMMYLGHQEERKGKHIVSLGVGIPFYPAPKHVHEYVINALKQKPTIDKYTLLTGLPELRELVAHTSSKDLGFSVSPEEILITPGSMSALLYSILALVNRGEEIILPSPYFSSNAEQVSLAEGKVVPVPMRKDARAGFRLDIERIKKVIGKKTKAILINNPQNPTGAVYVKEDLIELANILKNTNVYVITDEVYDYLIYDDVEYFNIASIKDLWPRIIRCCSLSKKYGMMGWRIGYLHTNKDLLMHILKIHDATIVCAPHVSQEAAIAAISGPQECVVEHRMLLKKNRDILCKRMREISDLFSFVTPRGTYYMFPQYSLPFTSIDMAKKLLYEAGVVMIPGIGFGEEGERHLRISFGAPSEIIHESMDRVKKWWKKI